MKKKNKGFTLIEILATIAIIAVVTLIATVTYNKVRKNIINRQYKNLKSLIEIAGVRYTSKTGKDKYFVEELIKEGYIDPDDDKGNIYDPRDDHPLNCHVVEVVTENDNYYANLGTVNYKKNDGCQLTCPNGECPVDKPWLNLIAYIHGTQINYVTTTNADEKGKVLEKDPVNIYKNVKIVDTDSGRWTNKQLDLVANLDVNLPFYVDIDGVKYIWNNDSAAITTSNTHTTNVEKIYNGPYSVEAVMKNNSRQKASITYKYDTTPPVIVEGSPSYVNDDEEIWKKSKTIHIEIVENGVGLDRIYVGKEPCENLLKNYNLGKKIPKSLRDKHVQTFDVKEEVGTDGENGQLNVCAVDLLGNLAVTQKFKVKKIDITPPHCTKDYIAKRKDDVKGEHNKYQYENRKIKQYCFDNNIINGTKVIGSGCNNNSENGNAEVKTFNPSIGSAIKVGYITITDNVGWTTKCPVDVYIDRKGPLCSKATGNTQADKTNHNATTLGVGKTSNWDQNYRHITQYCYDEHVGCMEDNYSDRKSNPSKSHSWDYNDGLIIRTRTITIWDKVPRCSQKSADGVCASMNLSSNDNKYGKNNSTACTEGVFIDHQPPVNHQNGAGFHGGNRIKPSCTDEPWQGVNGSGVKTFTTIASTRGSASEINPCHSSSDCSTSYSTTQSNYTGSKIQYKIDFVSLSINDPLDNVTVNATCVDKALNTTINDLEYHASIDDSTSFGRKYINEVSGKSNVGPSNGCYLKQYRTNSEGTCISTFSYDCERHDVSCNANNDGMGVTCCLQGEDRFRGCKTKGAWVNFNNPSTNNYIENKKYDPDQSDEKYMEYHGDYYVVPSLDDKVNKYDDHCVKIDGVTKCDGGYKCEHFNCYPDRPMQGNSQGGSYSYVCGNQTK